MAQDRKAGALESAVRRIESDYGRGAIMRLGAGSSHVEVETIPTGSIGVDLALGGRGLPRGRICEVFGPESSGKSTLCLSMVGAVQRAGGYAAYIDAEHAIDPTYVRRIGVDLDSLLLSQPDSGEQGLDIVEILVRSNAVDLIVVDSVAALVPRAELEGEIGDSHVGLQARLMSQAMRRLCAALSRSQAVAVFINQLREKIGVMFGSPETTPGGRALKFFSSVRLDVRRVATLKDASGAYGTRIRVKVVKNKIAPPFQLAEFDLLFDRGISREGELLDLGEKYGIVTRSGNTLSGAGQTLGASREKARNFLVQNPEVASALEKEIRARMNGSPDSNGAGGSKEIKKKTRGKQV